MSGHAQSTRPVVVGVDDSAAAVTAAVWALDEALCRHARLRLVHVIDDASVNGGFAYARQPCAQRARRSKTQASRWKSR